MSWVDAFDAHDVEHCFHCSADGALGSTDRADHGGHPAGVEVAHFGWGEQLQTLFHGSELDGLGVSDRLDGGQLVGEAEVGADLPLFDSAFGFRPLVESGGVCGVAFGFGEGVADGLATGDEFVFEEAVHLGQLRVDGVREGVELAREHSKTPWL